MAHSDAFSDVRARNPPNVKMLRVVLESQFDMGGVQEMVHINDDHDGNKFAHPGESDYLGKNEDFVNESYPMEQ